MSNILKTEHSVTVAQSFMSNMDRLSPAPDVFYMFFGRENGWADDNNPPIATDDVASETELRSALVGMKKIQSTQVAFVAPRYDWVSGNVYDQYDENDDLLYTKPFYVLNSNNNVYKCIDNSGGASSITEPTGTSTSNITTGDGYTWKFMFDISEIMSSNFLTLNFIPVPTGNQRSTFQISVENSATYTIGSPAEGHGSSAIHELGANRISFSATFENDENGLFPIDDDFRQVGIWKNPKLIADGSTSTGTSYSLNDSGSEIDINSGRILFIENRKPLSRSSDQTETFRLIIKF